jgi:hypothetical protein
MLAKPIPTNIVQLQPNLFVARSPALKLLLSGEGASPSAAARRLGKGIECQYRLLEALPRGSRSALHEKLFRSLKRYVKETNDFDDASLVGSKASRKTELC